MNRKTAFEDEAELAWSETMMSILRQYNPDTGWCGEQLLPDAQAAARAAGGVRFLWGASQWDLIWAKQKFLRAYRGEIEAEPRSARDEIASG
jgi:hypothetical protein